MKNLKTKKNFYVILFTLAIVIAILVALFFMQQTQERVIIADATSRNRQVESTIYSVATLEDSFCESTILVTLNRQGNIYSIQDGAATLREFTIADFCELNLYSIEELTPGLNLAQTQIASKYNRHMAYNESWSVDLDSFRRILFLTLNDSCKENVLYSIRLIEQRSDVLAAEVNFLTYIPSYSSVEYANLITANSAMQQANPNDQWALGRINAQCAWSITKGCNSVIVGVVDTGIQADHPCF